MKYKIKLCLLFLLTFVSSILIAISFWIPNTFGEVSFAQILFNLSTPIEGANNDYISDFIANCILTPFGISCLLFGILFFTLIRKHYKSQKRILSFFLVGFTICTFYSFNSIGASEYLIDISQSSSLYEDHYADATTMDFSFPETKRNLIYICLESMESSYYSYEENGLFDSNLIPELYQLAAEHTSFQTPDSMNGFYSPYGTTWTSGALSALTLGVPLTVPVPRNSYREDAFLPGAYGLGDVLESAGYNQSFVLGSNVAFGGRDGLFTSHGNYGIIDYYEAKERNYIESDYSVWWGLEDEKLFEMAKDELIRLSEEEDPFHLFTLTVDTHFEDGYSCTLCDTVYDDQYSNVLACSSKQVSEFVTWIQEQDFYENTTIIISGDHPTMDSDFFDHQPDDYYRKQYFTIINSAIEEDPSISRSFSSFDVLPTAIASLGITWEENRMGLGANLYSTEETLIELYGLNVLNSELMKNSHYYNNHILFE